MYCVEPAPLIGEFRAPPSKPMAQRLVLAAALAEGGARISGVELSDDVVAALRAAAPLASISASGAELAIEPREPERSRAVNVQESGFTYRIAAAIYAGIPGRTVIYTSGTLRRRPMGDYIGVLSKVAAAVREWPGALYVEGRRLEGLEVEVRADVSSQFVSGLMFLSTLAERGGVVRPVGPRKSWQYVEATAEVLRLFGARVELGDEVVVAGPLKSPGSASVPGDYSLSAFVLAAASITGGRARIGGLSGGPDKEIVDFVREMGVDVRVGEDHVEVEGVPERPVELDMSSYPDLVMPVALMAAFVDGESVLKGVEHLAYKESDRISTTMDVLRRIGASAAYDRGALKVRGPPTRRNATFSCHEDHRICLMAAAAARALGGCIDDVAPVAKSWPGALLIFS